MTEPVVHGVDHVYVPLSDSEAAYRVLTETLGLPIAWPYAAYGDFASGGINLGNLNVEVLRHSDAVPGSMPHSPARVQGIAFHPGATSRLLAELDHRGIVSADAPGGKISGGEWTGAMWTNVTLERLCNPATSVFTCEYHIPGMSDYDARQASLDECGGGSLGVTGVREIVISSPQPTDAAARWQQLLDPLSPTRPGYWELEHGPALGIIAGTADTVAQVVVMVRSLAAIEQSRVISSKHWRGSRQRHPADGIVGRQPRQRNIMHRIHLTDSMRGPGRRRRRSRDLASPPDRARATNGY